MRRILVLTGNRAEYGLLSPVLRAIEDHEALEAVLVVTGAHLSDRFGETIEEIRRDGFEIARTMPIPTEPDTPHTMATAAGACVQAAADALRDLAPDVSLVFGDRLEAFACAAASIYMNVPVAHISGGDRTGGGMVDTSVRHAITKIAHIHLATSEDSRRRILALGEEPWRVHNVGSTAVDNVRRGALASPDQLARELDLDLDRPIVVAAQHPLTQAPERAGKMMAVTLDALEDLGYQTVVTYPNNDAGSRAMIEEIERRRSVPQFRVVRSLGRDRYLGLLSVARALVGNSSSALFEAPALGLPAVNVGSRQHNRLRAANVLDVGHVREEIREAVRRAVEDREFRAIASECENPFGDGHAAEKIAEVLASAPPRETLLLKEITY